MAHEQVNLALTAAIDILKNKDVTSETVLGLIKAVRDVPHFTDDEIKNLVDEAFKTEPIREAELLSEVESHLGRGMTERELGLFRKAREEDGFAGFSDWFLSEKLKIWC